VDGRRRWVVVKRCVCVSLGSLRERSLQLLGCSCQTLPFPAYIFLSLFLPPSTPRFCVIDNLDMADVSDPKIQQGSFHNNTQQMPAICDETEPNSVFIAYLDVRSDKSDTNWLLLDYEACILFYFIFPIIPKEPLRRADLALWCPRMIVPINSPSPRRALVA